MYFIIALLILGFLVWAAGRETRFGGLGLLWRVALGLSGLLLVIAVIGGVYIWNEQKALEMHQEQVQDLEKKMNIEVGKRIRAQAPDPSAFNGYTDQEIGERLKIRNLNAWQKILVSPDAPENNLQAELKNLAPKSMEELIQMTRDQAEGQPTKAQEEMMKSNY